MVIPLEIPEEILSAAVAAVRANYPVGADEVLDIFKHLAAADRKFAQMLGKGDTKNFERWSSYNELLNKTKKQIYYSLRRYQQADAKGMIDDAIIVLERDGEITQELKDILTSIMQNHVSTAERMDEYPTLYTRIFAITGKPKNVLDVSCGYNPFSLPFFGLSNFEYHCTELKQADCNILQGFLDALSPVIGLKAKAAQLNLLEEQKSLPPEFQLPDITFLFKLIPVLERLRRGIGAEILRWVPGRWLVVSYSKKSMVKGEDIEKRESALTRSIIISAGLKVHSEIDTENEVFLVIERKS